MWFALGYLFFAIYGSLVPLEYQSRPLTEAWAIFGDIAGMSLSFVSRTDWLVNILLFIPLAFLLAGACWPAHGVVAGTLVALGVFALCLGFSVAIEFMQVFFPQRTPSINDIVAQSIGTGLGITAWITFGSRLSAWFSGWRSARSPLDIWKRFLYSYLFVLFGYSLLPLDLTISPVEVLHKWREGRLILLPFSFAFAEPIEAIYDLAVDVLLWMPAAFLWCLAFPGRRLRSWLAVVGAAAVLEFLQLFVYSRVSDVTDIFTAAAGAGAGILLAGRMGRTNVAKAARPLFHPSLGWLLLTLAWILVLAAIFLYPFDFQMDREFLLARLQGARKIPFEVYYFGTEYRAVTEVMHKAGFFFPLGALLALAVTQTRNYIWRRHAVAAAMAVIGMVALGIEAGQLFIPGKNVDVTDWMLEVLGGVAGFAIIRYLHLRLSAPAGRAAALGQRPPELNTMDTIKGTNPAGAQMQPRQAGTIIAIGIGILTVMAWLATRSDMVPYNVRELVDEKHPFLSVLLLAGAIYWIIGFPVLIVQWLAQGELYLLSLPVLALIHGLIAWILLRFAVPIESIHDIVGYPVLDWPWEWEMFGRFLALFSLWTVGATAGGIIASWHIFPGNKSALLAWIVGAFLLIPISYYVVVVAAATDNLVELMAGNGSLGAFLLIGLSITGVALGGMKGVLALIPGAAGRMPAAAWVLSAGILTYGALYYGTEQIIVKYNQVFSALQFLLSSNRTKLAGQGELLVRYVALYCFLVAAIIMVQYPLWRWLTPGPRQGGTQRQIGGHMHSSITRF